MPREDWPHDDREPDPRDRDPRDAYSPADDSHRYGYDSRSRSDRPGPYSAEWVYDAERGRPHDLELDRGEPRRGDDRDPPGRSWMSRAGEFFAGGGEARAYDQRSRDERAPMASTPRPPVRRHGPSDRVLFAVISERLETQRRLDLSDVQLHVADGEVTLEGTVRRKEDRRLIEDIADIEGVGHVQNNMRVREGRGWTFR